MDRLLGFLHPGPASLRTLGAVLFSVIWIYTALLTIPFAYPRPGTNIDSSHRFGGNYFLKAGFHYGTDVIFTFGPLEYLIYPEYIGHHVAVANLVRGALWLLLLAQFLWLYELGVSGLWKSLLLMLAIIAARNMLLNSFDYYALAVLIVMLVYMIERPEAWFGYIFMIVIAGALAMTKFSAYILAGLTIGLFLAVRCGWPPKLPGRKERALPVAVLLAAPIAFLLHNHSIRALFDYFYGSLQLSSGYSEAMSLATPAADLAYAVVLGSLFLLGVAIAAIKRTLPWTAASMLLALYWMNFKHGFVRSDNSTLNDEHTTIAYCFEIILAALLICLLRGRPRVILGYAAAFPIFAIFALSATNLHWAVWSEAFWSGAHNRLAAADLVHWSATAARIREEERGVDEFDRLPPAFRKLLDASTAAVFPWELVYARPGHFALQPLYTMQSYSAYTEYLDRRTARRIRAARDRTEYILFEWKSIDDRHPLLDVPQTWTAMVDNYRLEEIGDGKLLLKRRDTPLAQEQVFLKRISLPIGRWIDLPRTTTELWGRIHIPYSFAGKLRETLYKADAIYLAVSDSNNMTTRFRIVPGVLSHEFPLSSLPTDFVSLVDILKSQRVAAPIVRIRLEASNPDHYREGSLELLESTKGR
ncbi:MAG TPA: hypothetical protein VGR73_16250 [Bryobacteraceae bacterium]|nr:hypothetical protein [Bryobacteraceae bacterium]